MGEAVVDNSQGQSSPRPYRFGHSAPARTSLDELHAAFAHELSAAVSQHLRGVVEIHFNFAEQLRYSDYLYSLSETSCLSVLRIDPPGAQACLDISLSAIYPMIDRMLGGRADAGAATPVPHRPLTQIEQGLALQIVERAAAALGRTWDRAAPLSVREEWLESSPADVRIMPEAEMVTAARFDVRIGSAGGTMSLCIPAPVVQYLSEVPPPMRSLAERDAARDNLQGNLLQAAVELRALLAQTKLRLSDVLNMQAGDVITTEKGVGEEVALQVEGREKFQGRVGQFRGARAVEITRGGSASTNSTPPQRETLP